MPFYGCNYDEVRAKAKTTTNLLEGNDKRNHTDIILYQLTNNIQRKKKLTIDNNKLMKKIEMNKE